MLYVCAGYMIVLVRTTEHLVWTEFVAWLQYVKDLFCCCFIKHEDILRLALEQANHETEKHKEQ